MGDGAGMEATAVDSEHEEQEEDEEEDEQQEEEQQEEEEEEEPAALRKKLSSLFDQVSKLEATLAEKETPPASKSVARAGAGKETPPPSKSMARAATPSPGSDATTLQMSPLSSSEVPSVVTPAGHHRSGLTGPTPSDKGPNRRQRRTAEQRLSKAQSQSPAKPKDAMDEQIRAMQEKMQEQAAQIEACKLARKKAEEAATKVDPREEMLMEMKKKMEEQEALIQSLKAPPVPAQAADPSSDQADIVMPDGAKVQSTTIPSTVISRDALRMRLKRLCETKKSGKKWVSDEVAADYAAGGEKRETLEISLLEVLRDLPGDAKPDRMRAAFTSKVVHVKERLLAREQEVTGEWLTEERMKNKHG
ncbi:unnamed protein product, partial [Symbiodinium necroappetens]